MYTTCCGTIFVYEHMFYSKGVIDTTTTATTTTPDSAASSVAEIPLAEVTISTAKITQIAIMVATLAQFDEIYLIIFKILQNQFNVCEPASATSSNPR